MSTNINCVVKGKSTVGFKNGMIFRAPFGTGTSPASPSWVQIDQGMFDGPITDIALSPNNADEIAVSVGGYDDDNVFVSFNNGSAWNSRSNGIPALHVNTLEWHFETSDWLYAGTDLGVFSTEDNSMNWNTSPNYSGISDGPVFTEITHLEWGLKFLIMCQQDIFMLQRMVEVFGEQSSKFEHPSILMKIMEVPYKSAVLPPLLTIPKRLTQFKHMGKPGILMQRQIPIKQIILCRLVESCWTNASG